MWWSLLGFLKQVSQHKSCFILICYPPLSWSIKTDHQKDTISLLLTLVVFSSLTSNKYFQLCNQLAQAEYSTFALVSWYFNFSSAFYSDINACRFLGNDLPCLHYFPPTSFSGRSRELLPGRVPVVGGIMSSFVSPKMSLFWFPQPVNMLWCTVRGS